MTGAWDTIIVGAGPAGCTLAARLTEDAARRVLLIEAGPDYGPDPANWPPELLEPYHSEVVSHSWGLANREDSSGRRLPLPRGRVVGGSSAINACQWYRGSRSDYDGWEALGNPGWGYDALEPYFQRAECDLTGRPGYHGTEGPVRITRAAPERLSQIDRAVLETAEELGLEPLDDMNGSAEQRPAAGLTPKNIVDDIRWSAALSHLALARPRPNFSLLPGTLIDRVICDGGRATGVRAANGRELQGREVILTAGSYGSPAILLRSGIGPAAELAALGIPLVNDRPGVGRHLLDHPLLAPYTSGLTTFPIRRGAEPARPTFIQTVVMARSSQVTEEIDLHLYPREKPDPETGRWLFGWGISLMVARSQGTVRLTSRDPEAPLEIDHNYFADRRDLEALTDGVELAFRLVRTRPLAEFVEAPPQPARDALREIVQREAGTTFHPSSTCRMGPASDPEAVVDAEGRVYGLAGLRVADASIFPSSPRANLQAPIVAVAERLADLIRGRVGVPAASDDPRT